MSIINISVRGFQSLRHVDLDLGVFTVIVGPSSSGKSALIRAFRALASNVRGSTVITRGQKQMAITATLDDGLKVTLERGERSSCYRLSGDGEHQFTKLAGEVPEQITKTLRLDPGADSINFAAQFDKPYLLDDSGATVARHLAELTNVNAIFEAVRAANKIRASAQTTLKTRRADLDQVRSDLTEFTGLADRLKAFAEVEALNERRKALQDRLGRLQRAAQALRTTVAAMEHYKPLEVPDPWPLADALRRYLDLRAHLAGLAAKQDQAQRWHREVLARANDVQRYEEALAAKMAEVKICPTCGQQISPLPG